MSVSDWSVATLGHSDDRYLVPVGVSLPTPGHQVQGLPTLSASSNSCPLCHLLILGGSALSSTLILCVRKNTETACTTLLDSVVTEWAKGLTRSPQPLGPPCVLVEFPQGKGYPVISCLSCVFGAEASAWSSVLL